MEKIQLKVCSADYELQFESWGEEKTSGMLIVSIFSITHKNKLIRIFFSKVLNTVF